MMYLNSCGTKPKIPEALDLSCEVRLAHRPGPTPSSWRDLVNGVRGGPENRATTVAVRGTNSPGWAGHLQIGL